MTTAQVLKKSANEDDASLSALSLRGPITDAKGASELASALSSMTPVSDLNMCWNYVGPIGASVLAGYLHENNSVAVLNLEGNLIGNEGAKALARTLRHNSRIKCLVLRDNLIGDEGATALAASLDSNISAMPNLDLSSNDIGAEGAEALAVALQHNRISHLDLSGNVIGKRGLQAFSRAILHNIGRIPLDLESIAKAGQRVSSPKYFGDEVWFIFKLAGLSLSLQRKEYSQLLAAVYYAGMAHLIQRGSLVPEEAIPQAIERMGSTVGLLGVLGIVRNHQHVFSMSVTQ